MEDSDTEPQDEAAEYIKGLRPIPGSSAAAAGAQLARAKGSASDGMYGLQRSSALLRQSDSALGAFCHISFVHVGGCWMGAEAKALVLLNVMACFNLSQSGIPALMDAGSSQHLMQKSTALARLSQ